MLTPARVLSDSYTQIQCEKVTHCTFQNSGRYQHIPYIGFIIILGSAYYDKKMLLICICDNKM